MSPQKLLLIDGNAIMHRAYHALPPLSTKKGELVNAVYGFASTLLSVIDKFKPEYIVATFDLPGPTFRHKDFDSYKATRVKAPDEFYVQIPRVKEVVRAFNIPIYEKEGFEADDLIGTIVKKTEQLPSNLENIIITGDLDTLQLVSKKTKVYTMRRGLSDSFLYDSEKVKERYGLEPTQLADYKGLRGDSSDNIPGVKGIGEKTAAELLQVYNNLENIYKSLDRIKPAIREKLERDKAAAILSKKLGTIEIKVPLEFDIKNALTHDFDRSKLSNLFQELNFYSLIKRIPNQAGEQKIQEKSKEEKFGQIGVKETKYVVVSANNFTEFSKLFSEQNTIALALAGDIGMAFSWKAGRSYFLKFSENLNFLRNILENNNIKKIAYDFKTIHKILKKRNITVKGGQFDIMISAYLLDAGSSVDFERIILKELGEEINFVQSAPGQLAIGLDKNEENEKVKTALQKADYTWKVQEILEEKITAINEEQKKIKQTSKTIQYVLEKIEIPLIKILADMEIVGIKINPLVLEGISRKIVAKIKTLEESIYKLAGESFNINSPKQLTVILFEKLKLDTGDIKKIKTGYSTASSELVKLRDKHKIIGKVEEYREIFKLKTTYLDILPNLLDEKSRIHTTFNQAVTATGRLSSSDPNLQNIPIKSDIGQLIRTAFVAEENYCLVSADYSQIDLRAVAHVSGDKKLIDAFYRGQDIHRITAAEINKIPPSQVTDKMRRAAKALNFGVIYGMSVFGFSQAAGVDREVARNFINEYMEKFSGVAGYIKKTKEFAKKYGYVETIFGRRRNIAEINSPNFQVAQAAERMAINMPIQGLAADIVKLAMIQVHEEYKNNPDVRMVLQIHDEIILEVKEGIAKEVSEKVKSIMETVYKLRVPLVVDVKIGDTWGEI